MANRVREDLFTIGIIIAPHGVRGDLRILPQTDFPDRFLEKTGVTNAAIVVTRYFGGIKLGAGGLIRAYSHAASLATHGAPKELHALRQVLHITLDYALYGSIERLLVDQGYSYTSGFGAQVSLAVYVPPQDLSSLSEAITNATGGKAIIECGDLQEVSLPYQESDSSINKD